MLLNFFTKHSVVAVCVVFLLNTAVFPADIYVSPDGSAESPYNTWPKAARDIQTAVNAAAADDTVWISNGVYELEATIAVSKKVTLCGNPGELIVIDGKGMYRCFNVTQDGVVLSNLFITGGAETSAGGVSMKAGKIIDCVFSNNNTTINGGAVVSSGGGEIINSLFVDNHSALNGGALYLSGNANRVQGCCFVQNNVLGDGGMGGAIYGNSLQNSIFDNNQVLSNTAQNKGGGIYMSVGSGNLFTNCHIAENVTLTNAGGGMWSSGGFEMSHCNFVSNATTQTTQTGEGAGAYLYNGNLRIKNSYFAYNTAIGNGGGLYLRTEAGGEIRDSLFCHNNARYGGGIIVFNKNNVLINCTIVSNLADSGAGIWSSTGENYAFTSINCIVYFNYLNSGNLHNYSTFNENVVFSNNCLYPQFPATYVRSANNISDDPLFVNFNAGDYRLTADSPCINQGVNLDGMDKLLDFDGRARQDRFSGKVDMGCYEYLPAGIIFRMR